MGEDIERRLNSRLNRVKDKRSNCIGTALFLVEEVKRDRYMLTLRCYEERLRKLKEVSPPQEGCLIAWINTRNLETMHLGIVTNASPILVTSRRGREGSLHLNDPLNEVNDEYRGKGIEVRYFLPTIIEKEGSQSL